MESLLNFSIEKYNVLKDNDRFMILEAYIVSDGLNKHDCIVTVDAMNKAMPTLANIPIICIFDEYGKDFIEHSRSSYETKYKQKCVGSVPESHDAEIVQYAGRNFVKANVIIWKSYAPQVAERFIANNVASISMEMKVLGHHQNSDGKLTIDNYEYHAITLLGEDYNPAIPNANVRVTKFAEDKYKNIIRQFSDMYYMINNEYKIPEVVKYNASRALNKPQTNIELIKFARMLSKTSVFKFEDVQCLYNKINNIRKPDNLIFYGGEESKEWCTHIIENIEGGAKALDEVKDNIINEEFVDAETAEIETDIETETSVDDINTEEITSEDSVENEIETPAEEDDKDELAQFATNMDLFRIISDMVSELKDDNGYCKYWMMDFDSNFVYVFDCDSQKYARFAYAMQDELPSIDFESEEYVYPTTEWIVASNDEMPEKYSNMFSEVGVLKDTISETKNALNLVTSEKEAEVSKYSELEQKYNDVQILNAGLMEFKDKTVKEQMQNHANQLYESYSEFLSETEVEKFNTELFNYDTFAMFEKEVKSFIMPKVMAKIESMSKNGIGNKEQEKIGVKVLMNASLKNDDKASPKTPLTHVEKIKSLF